MVSNKFAYRVYLNGSRSFGGFENLVSDWDSFAWQGLKNSFSKRQYKTIRDGLVTIEIDWSNPLEKALERRELYKGSQEDIIRYYSEVTLEELTKKPLCEAHVLSEDGSPLNRGIDYLKYFLYECFLIMNLSSPGSFNLYNSYIELENYGGKDRYNRERDDLICSEYIFENALHDSLNFHWPVIQYLNFETVLKWYLSQDVGIIQVAKTRLQKSLFSLLHISEKGMGPDTLMWCAYCLESLYDTPNALSFNFLVSRISELLAVPIDKKKVLSKRIRDFYDHRNAFAHGNAKAIHPIGHEGWDKEVDTYRGDVQSACDFAALIIISSLQQYILRNVKEIKYVEQSQYIEV